MSLGRKKIQKKAVNVAPSETPARSTHQYSWSLLQDARVNLSPRFVAPVFKSEKGVILAKVYSGLNSVGSELVTIEVVDAKEAAHEIRFDEILAPSIHFRKMSDIERSEFVKAQLAEFFKTSDAKEVFKALVIFFRKVEFGVRD